MGKYLHDFMNSREIAKYGLITVFSWIYRAGKVNFEVGTVCAICFQSAVKAVIIEIIF
jgi:hypothetical protein